MLDGNVELRGRPSNNSPLVQINNTGTLIMNEGASITGNAITVSNNSGGTGGSAGSRGSWGGAGGPGTAGIRGYSGYPCDEGKSGGIGGVKVNQGGTFIMNGGEIKNNTGSTGGGGDPSWFQNGNRGGNGGNGGKGGIGGVYAVSGGFVKNGGTISENFGGDGATAAWVAIASMDLIPAATAALPTTKVRTVMLATDNR